MDTIGFKFLTSKLTKEQCEKMSQIAKRAKKLGANGDILSIKMDIEAGILGYDIDLDKLEKFDDFNLMHDIFGIQERINRHNYYFYDDGFVPRSAMAVQNAI